MRPGPCAQSPSLGAATSHGADSGVPTGLADETGLMRMSMTQKRKKSRNPQTLGEGADISWWKLLFLKIFPFPLATSAVHYAGWIRCFCNGDRPERVGRGRKVSVLPTGWGRSLVLKGTSHDQQRKTERFLPHSPSSLPPPRKGPDTTHQTEASWCLPLPPMDLHIPTWSSPALFTLALVGKC